MTQPLGQPPADWIVPQWPAPAGVQALITTRVGGVSKGPYAGPAGSPGMNVGYGSGDATDAVARNRERLRAFLPAEPSWLRQVHGAHVVDGAVIDGAVEADASFTVQPGTVIGVMIADCMPVLLSDTEGRCVAAAHAGWRGLAAGVLQATVKAMRERVGRHARILAFLGPAIGPDHFEVGPEVREAMMAGLENAAEAFVAHGDGKFRADLFALGRLALAEQGVSAVFGGGVCTYCDADRFYSHRRDRVTGRHAALIWRLPA